MSIKSEGIGPGCLPNQYCDHISILFDRHHEYSLARLLPSEPAKSPNVIFII